jgi:GxxExxY protein
MLVEQDVTHKILGAAIEVHKQLGPGLLESAYRVCLGIELKEYGLSYQQEIAVPLDYKGNTVDCAFRLDFLIEDAIVLELKSADVILPVHEAQLLTYMRLTNKKIGLLINFKVPILKQGIRRLVLNA